MAQTLLLITADPSQPMAKLALRYATAALTTSNLSNMTNPPAQQYLRVFFYANGAHTANRLRWQSADIANITAQWQKLAAKHNLTLLVCVSTALSRGISDDDNSQRHQLTGSNIAEGFNLVGLSELAMMMQDKNCRLIQF